MKTTMKLFATLMIMFAFASNIFAQTNTGFNTITSQATVATAISVAGNADGLNFGLVTPGINKTLSNTMVIDPVSSTSGDEKLGAFTVGKGANTQLKLEFELPTILNGSSSTTMPIEFLNTSARLSDDGLINNVTFDPNTVYNIVQTGSTGFAYIASSFKVYIGGKVKPGTSQASGNYTNTIKLTATYN